MTLNTPPSWNAPALPPMKTMAELHYDATQLEGLAMCASLICDYAPANDPRVAQALGTLTQVIADFCSVLTLTTDGGIYDPES
jgi:hypothetical protein